MAQFKHTTTYTLGCPTCGGSHIVKMGIRNGQQRYLCRNCHKAFRASGKAKGRRMDAELMGSAIRDYYSGKSYKQIAEGLADEYDIPEPSKATIFEWVRDYTDRANREMEGRKAKTSGHWVADEMYVKVGGKTAYNWNVMDSETRYILASHLSPTRDGRAARAVIRKALESADAPPRTIKTDKWRAYIKPIKELAPDAQHIQSQGLSAEVNNNRSERLQGTYRDREKTLRGLDSIQSGQRYLDGWTLQYNLFRDHHSLGGRKPAEAAKVDTPFREWADVVKADTMAKVAVVSDIQSERVRPDLLDVPRAATPTPKVDLDLTDLEASRPEPSRRLRFDAYAPARLPQRVGRERLGRGQGRGLTESRYRVGRRRR
jgi:putative transposase